MNTTELNRAVARKLGLTEFKDGVIYWQMDDGLPACKWYDDEAWADSADVALAELWPLLDDWEVLTDIVQRLAFDMATKDWNGDPAVSIAIAICDAYLSE